MLKNKKFQVQHSQMSGLLVSHEVCKEWSTSIKQHISCSCFKAERSSFASVYIFSWNNLFVFALSSDSLIKCGYIPYFQSIHSCSFISAHWCFLIWSRWPILNLFLIKCNPAVCILHDWSHMPGVYHPLQWTLRFEIFTKWISFFIWTAVLKPFV